MYIVRNYTALLYLNPADEIFAVLTPIPFDNQYGELGRINWSITNLLYRNNYLIQYQRSSPIHYPPDTNPHNNNYTYMPIGASIHDVQYTHDFENYYGRYYSDYINLLIRYLNANN